MKLLYLALTLFATAPLYAEFGYRQSGTLQTFAVNACEVGRIFDTWSPCYVMVNLNSTRPDVTGFLVTVTFLDASGQHGFKWSRINRQQFFSSDVFEAEVGMRFLTLEVEQCTDSGCFDWHQIRLD